jgi:hypothetical protein
MGIHRFQNGPYETMDHGGVRMLAVNEKAAENFSTGWYNIKRVTRLLNCGIKDKEIHNGGILSMSGRERRLLKRRKPARAQGSNRN